MTTKKQTKAREIQALEDRLSTMAQEFQVLLGKKMDIEYQHEDCIQRIQELKDQIYCWKVKTEDASRRVKDLEDLLQSSTGREEILSKRIHQTENWDRELWERISNLWKAADIDTISEVMAAMAAVMTRAYEISGNQGK